MDLHELDLRRVAVVVAMGCTSPDWSAELASDDGMVVADAFVHHQSFRTDALEHSLREPVREYGALRREHYGRAWERLPVFDPTALSDSLPDTLDGLVELGRRAFVEYPLRPSRQWWPVLEGEPFQGLDPDTFVMVEVGPDTLPAQTCATCHSTVRDGQRVLGAPSPELELGSHREPPWAIGTVDPTADGIDNPTTVGDLRPVRYQSTLHWAGTLTNGLAALAVRIDTLLITSMRELSRPPRIVPVAIAAYLWSLGEALPEPDLEAPGAAVFQANCAMCHDLEHPAEPVPALLVGTDPAATASTTRGTGHYRVPSLRGVGSRRPLLHDASMPSLDDLWDAEREGHGFGMELPASERKALQEWLSTL